MRIYHRTDPGHGWLSVKRQLIEELGISDQISSYSYQRGERVYLEEDCDASLFVEAARAAGMTINIVTTYADKTPIRGYECYSPRSYAAWFATAGSGDSRSTNAIRFATRAECDRYALDLLLRWTGASDYDVRPSSDPVNYAIKDDQIVRLESAS